MSETIEAGKEFKQLIAELFGRLGCNEVVVDHTYAGELWHDYDIDLLYGVQGDTTVAEVKYYRIGSPPRPDLILSALQSARHLKNVTGAQHCALIVSCELPDSIKSQILGLGDVDFWDLKRIFTAAQTFPEIFRKLAISLEIDVNKASSYVGSSNSIVHDNSSLDKEGSKLAKKLKEVPAGLKGFRAFEDACISSLKYLFEQDLAGWHEQHQTHDRNHRRDLVCRALPNSELWSFVLTDLKSRYTVFEFKNYSDLVSEAEVCQAEKYLFPVALRCVAFIISPKGLSSSALAATYGAMRDAGKMIISITTDDLIQMLIGKDMGTDPNVTVFKMVDEFLMGLGR